MYLCVCVLLIIVIVIINCLNQAALFISNINEAEYVEV